MLAAAHPRLVAPSPLHAFAEAFGLNQLLSVEYVDALAAYLKARLAALGAPGGPVAEVGAGIGVLAAALRQRGVPLARRAPTRSGRCRSLARRRSCRAAWWRRTRRRRWRAWRP